MILRIFLLLMAFMATGTTSMDQQTYVIHMDKAETQASYYSLGDSRQRYEAMINSITKSSTQEQEKGQETTPPQILYVYEKAITGFAAKLSNEQVKALSKINGFLSAIPDEMLSLHTTYTPQFLGLEAGKGLWNPANLVSDVIIGVLDTGIWPEHISFQDSGMSAVPSRWKVACENGPKFSPKNCNKKLVGARAFFKGYEAAAGTINETVDYRSCRDSQGHGTHTASTAAGYLVGNASFLGLGNGSAAGMKYTARIAAYKVCWQFG